MGWRKQDRDWEAIKAGEKKTMRCSIYGAEGGGVQGAVHLWLSHWRGASVWVWSVWKQRIYSCEHISGGYESMAQESHALSMDRKLRLSCR